MNDNTIDIKFGRLFPWHFLFMGAIVFIVGLALIVEKTLLSLALLVVSGIMLTGMSGTEINKTQKTYREYNCFFFFIKTGSKLKYKAIEKLFITSSKVSQTMYSRANHSATFSNTEFNGYIKFDDGVKIQLLRKKNKSEVATALGKISRFLGTEVVDHVVAQRY